MTKLKKSLSLFLKSCWRATLNPLGGSVFEVPAIDAHALELQGGSLRFWANEVAEL